MKKLIISIIFAFVNLFTLSTSTLPVSATNNSLMDAINSLETTETTGTTQTTQSGNALSDALNDLNGNESTGTTSEDDDLVTREDLCVEGLDSISWLLCPKVEAGSNAVDWLYEKIETVLEINPISGESGNVIVKIWEICRGITNIVFVILFLMIVLSQITGFGISNYGIKRALPKLIIAAVAVNLSFYICNAAIDLSNIIGLSTRNIFSGIEASIVGAGSGTYKFSELTTSFSQYYAGLAGTGTLLVGLTPILFESGVIFMLIPSVLIALVAVISGFITIALRQVVVVLCVMVAPLAIVAMIFPNTYPLFRKWRSTLLSMLMFYPMFSLLFGASSLAGFAVVQAAGEDGFMVLVGMIIQLAPLILCWKMMKMSGTVLNGVHSFTSGLMTRFAVKPAAGYAASLAANRRAHTLAKLNPYTPYARLAQYVQNRRMSREIDTAEYNETSKQRAMAYNADRHYKLDSRNRIRGVTKDGEEAYAMQARRMRYQRSILRDKNAMNAGLGQLKRLQYTDKDQRARLVGLDIENVTEADRLFQEQVRTSDIDYRNALSRNERFNNAINSHVDNLYGREFGHRHHFNNAPSRYDEMRDIMGSAEGAQYAAATAASVAASQRQIRQGQFQKYFDNVVPTQDVVNRLKELTSSRDATQNMDAIIAGMRTLNQRGDGKLLRESIENLVSHGKLEVGTQASQALANFVMTEVKDNDPFLRRFGKYINLETARYYNTDAIAEGKNRKRKSIDLKEYVMDGYDYIDENGAVKHDTPKRGMTKLLMGTSFKGVEREAYLNILEGIDTACGVDSRSKEKIGNNALNAIMANIVGDQFNYQSGSEQINALAKFITAMKVKGYENGDPSKPIYEWDKDTLAMLSSDPNKAKDIAYSRTCEFLKAQVPNQIARSKTDMLYAMQQVFVRKAAEDFAQGTPSKEMQEWRAEEAKDGFKVKKDAKGNLVSDQDRYAHYLFRNSLKDATRGGLAKTIARGYQGDTKENLLNAMGYNDYEDNALISKETEEYAPNIKNNKSNNNNDPVDDDDDYISPSLLSWNSNPEGEIDHIIEGANGQNPSDVARYIYDEYRKYVNNPEVEERLRSIMEGSSILRSPSELKSYYDSIRFKK